MNLVAETTAMILLPLMVSVETFLFKVRWVSVRWWLGLEQRGRLGISFSLCMQSQGFSTWSLCID